MAGVVSVVTFAVARRSRNRVAGGFEVIPMSVPEPVTRDEGPERTNDSALDYARRLPAKTKKGRHILALTYAAVAIPVGLLLLLLTCITFTVAIRENTTYERRYEGEKAVRLLACTALLLGSGVWYGRAGLRDR